tara:strand:+ start:53 stop:349 length:297 start_codon:yes stop_codon:yes gene_type:complete
MKKKIFNQYVDKVCYIFGIEKETLFTKTKRRDVVDARHLLYYLCRIRPMNLTYIQEYMMENGYNIMHSSIHHGVKIVTKKMESDPDYIKNVEDILDEA